MRHVMKSNFEVFPIFLYNARIFQQEHARLNQASPLVIRVDGRVDHVAMLDTQIDVGKTVVVYRSYEERSVCPDIWFNLTLAKPQRSLTSNISTDVDISFNYLVG